MEREEITSLEQLVQTYSLFSKFIARRFARSFPGVDIDDLASSATVQIVRCPKERWNEHPYIKRLIINAIFNETRDRKRYKRAMLVQAPEYWNNEQRRGAREFDRRGTDGHFVGKLGDSTKANDYFDTIIAKGDFASDLETSLDSSKALHSLKKLTNAERLVIEFHFGLNGLRPIGESAIALRLGRTKHWVQKRLQAGLTELRKEIGVAL